MEYRHLDKQNIDISLLGFGCMRFPTNAEGDIDTAAATAMLETARANGVNYFDTAYPYHQGASESFLGTVIKNWPRESYFLTTKLPVGAVITRADADRIFAEQLERLQVDYFDFYLFHAVDAGRYQKMLDLDLLTWAEELKAAGKIKNIGFSFHDEYPLFETMLMRHNWDCCQIQYNYMDIHHQAGRKGLLLAEKMGIPVFVMEPIHGGGLSNLPEDITAACRALREGASMSSWALRWVGSHSGVKMMLSGMSEMAHVHDNLATFSPFEPLSAEEDAAVSTMANALAARKHNDCTNCRYCMPCPAGVNIPRNFAIWNNFALYGFAKQTKFHWAGMGEAAQADKCVGCGACEAVCPQQISIRDDLAALYAEISAL